MESLLIHCRDHGLRITVALRALLKVLSESRLPQALHELEQHPDLVDACDRATIFRTLQRLEGVGLLRRLNFSGSAAKFSLNTGSAHKEYLICKSCGEVQVLEMSCPVHSIEKELAEKSGFREMTHELTFYGLCPACKS